MEKQNRDKTAIFKSKGLHFWDQVPGLQLGRNSLDPPYAPQKKAESRTALIAAWKPSRLKIHPHIKPKLNADGYL